MAQAVGGVRSEGLKEWSGARHCDSVGVEDHWRLLCSVDADGIASMSVSNLCPWCSLRYGTFSPGLF